MSLAVLPAVTTYDIIRSDSDNDRPGVGLLSICFLDQVVQKHPKLGKSTGVKGGASIDPNVEGGSMANRKKGSHFYGELRQLMYQREQTLTQLASELHRGGYPITASGIGKYRERYPPSNFLIALARLGYTHEDLERLMAALQRDLRDDYLP